MTQRPTLLTVSEVRERLATKGIDVTDETVRQWARTEKVRHTKLPVGRRRYLFAPEDVDALVEVREVAAA